MFVSPTTVLVVGAAGRNAGLVVPALVHRGLRVRAFVRSKDKGALAINDGADEVAIGDLRDVRTIAAAMDGTDGVFHIGPAFLPDEAEIGYAVIQAAVHARMKKFVFSSVMHPQIGGLLNHEVKLRVEDRLLHSGLDFTILQPAVFMQNVARALPSIEENGAYAEPWDATKKSAYVDYADVAEAAALAMTEGTYRNTTLELSGDGMWSREDIACFLSEALGRPIRAEKRNQEDAAGALRPDPYLREGMLRMWRHYDRHGFAGGGNSFLLRTILRRPPTAWPEFLIRERCALGARRNSSFPFAA
jgi:uncharacterized protein YbjT (DUF2867 family)